MTKGRRFFIFFSSAGIMTAFLLFTLSVRQDKPLEKYMDWFPNDRVISMITERTNAQNKVFPKRVDFIGSAVTALETFELTKLEVLHALKDGDVEFSHDRTKPRETPRQYYVIIQINDVEYALIAKVQTGYSEISELMKIENN